MEDNEGKESVIYPVIRHLLQMGGTSLAGMGVITQDDASIVIGALVSLLAVSWGICKRKGVKLCQY